MKISNSSQGKLFDDPLNCFLIKKNAAIFYDSDLGNPYSNSYSGYITTTEEYQVQAYEGGHTVFGQWSIGAIYQITNDLLSEFEKKSDKRKTPMNVLSEYDNLDLEMLMYKG